MASFHYTLMQAHDASQYKGRTLTRAHYAIREALRRKNMKGSQFANLNELVTFVFGFRPEIPAEEIRAAA